MDKNEIELSSTLYGKIVKDLIEKTLNTSCLNKL